LTVVVRIEGPADAATFRETGEYVTIWAGEVEYRRKSPSPRPAANSIASTLRKVY
jgi:hypothetical protein